ncbi:translation elongation factor Ts [Mycoplasma sp. 'Moose RK']|uniref:translation elongation factor Ts n=1 Tax=Mycoplasma sp. 'Moose RK' TaxID=2780095 RepID=UPI0018C2BA15|nr:translation elongation factor Ts [Mycoplasma sp. 'Moose RK']MBG0731027.1 elongation factor Ts [Mycoplasma sp. 'Moose RK']
MSNNEKLAKIKELRQISDAPFVDCKTALEKTDYNIDAAVAWLSENGKTKALKKSGRIAAEGLVLAASNENFALIFELNSETDFVAKNKNFIDLQQKIKNLLLTNDFENLDQALSIKDESGKSISELLVDATATMGEKISLRWISKTKVFPNQNVGIYTHANGQIATITILENGDFETAKSVAMHAAALNPEFIFKTDIPQERLEQITNQFSNSPNLNNKPEKIKQTILQGMIEKELSKFVLEFQPFAMDSAVSVKKYIESRSAKLLKVVRFEVGEGVERQVVDFSAEVQSQIQEASKTSQ